MPAAHLATSADGPAIVAGIAPIVPLTRPDAFDDAAWTFEPKYDGLRGFVHASGSGCEVRTAWDDRFEGFAELRGRVARVLGSREVILDGEIVSLDPKGRPVFRELLRGRGYLAFAAFDLLWLDGHDLRGAPLGERKQELAALLPFDTGPLYKVFSLPEHGRALFEAAKKMDLEGIVAKRTADPYGPDTVWYAIRTPAYRQRDGWLDLARTRRTTARRER